MPSVGPFGRNGRFLKGCLHTHSDLSDGHRSASEVLDWYRSRGYHFVALTDHRVCSESEKYDDDFVTLSGVEIDTLDPDSGLCHLVGLGVAGLQEQQIPRDTTAQAASDALGRHASLVVLAHPYWSCQLSKDLLGLEGPFAVEVFNGSCELGAARGSSAVHWDDLLTAGRRIRGVAVDDAHWREGSRDAGLGWVWVRAEELTEPTILQALEEGLFYSSSGPLIHDMGIDGDEIWVRCSPVKNIDFVSNLLHSCRVSAEAGGALTEARQRLSREQTYVRVACQDFDGQWAWGNPLFLTPHSP